jgi:anthranilate synthase
MFVRCEATQLRTTIAQVRLASARPVDLGTVARGANALEDAQRVKKSLSIREESELTMCTDVDRNDKSRICEPGSVK